MSIVSNSKGDLGKVSRGLDHLINSPSKDILQASVSELRVSDGGMVKCLEDHSEFREEHSERQSRGTSLRCSEAQRIRSSLKASRYKKLKPHVKGNLEMSQFVTLIFSINGDVQ